MESHKHVNRFNRTVGSGPTREMPKDEQATVMRDSKVKRSEMFAAAAVLLLIVCRLRKKEERSRWDRIIAEHW